MKLITAHDNATDTTVKCVVDGTPVNGDVWAFDHPTHSLRYCISILPYNIRYEDLRSGEEKLKVLIIFR